jgi:hypothetical protein
MIPPTEEFVVEKAKSNLMHRFTNEKAEIIKNSILSLGDGNYGLKDLVVDLSSSK